jgi:membrane-bound lytic murein transglycosylase F
MKMKRDPDIWYDMKQVLPQLARPEIYARLKSGAARGGEAVIMVENIRSYYDILRRFEPAYDAPFSTQPAFRRRELPPSRPSMAAAPREP